MLTKNAHWGKRRLYSSATHAVACLALVGQWIIAPLSHAQANGNSPESVIPKGWIPSPLIIEFMGNIRKQHDDSAAIDFLNEQFLKKAARQSDFRVLFHEIWQEAQFGAGRSDNLWGSRLNDAAFLAAYKAGYYAEASEMINNLCSRLTSAGRHGRLAEIHDFLEKSYRSAGMNMDISSYPDRGPAITRLPSIRHRNVDIRLPFSKTFPAGQPIITRVSGFSDREAGALLNYAFYKSYRGFWQDGLEWTIWARDWASDDKGQPTQSRSGSWYLATMHISKILASRGFHDEALEILEEASAAPYGMDYRGRPKINLELHLLDLKRIAGKPDPEMIPKLRKLVERIENHMHFGKSSHWEAKIMLANALIELRQQSEGETLLDQLISEGSQSARLARLYYWINIGRTEGVENELIELLRLQREDGLKYNELGLYTRYADFLEKAGRLEDALLMRREAVRICRSFDTSLLPTQLAKLAVLLRQLGDIEGSKSAEKEVSTALLANNIPPKYVAFARETIEKIHQIADVKVPESKQETYISFQPLQSMVIPIEGMPWKTYIAISNASSVSKRGQLKVTGAATKISVEDASTDILMELSDGAGGNDQMIDLTIAPGSYRLIAVSANDNVRLKGELKLKWVSTDGSKPCDSVVWIEEPEVEVQSAVLQAGKYQANPFYGITMYLSYVSKNKTATSSPIRFKSSQVSRVEIYLLDGTPLAIDGQGNGSLSNGGDELFAASDMAGNLMLPMNERFCFLQICVYPKDPIAKDGLLLDVEVFDGEKWNPYSQNRINP